MIFATILKVKCIAFDNLSHKVKNVYDIYLKNVPYVEFLNNSLSFEKKLDQMLNMDLEKIKHPKFNFRKLKLVMLKLYWRFYGKN
jgi:exopolysaccharide biosynthesis predicted pyruvyltransferase EpsI